MCIYDGKIAPRRVTVDLMPDELRDVIAAIDDIPGRKDKPLRLLRYRLNCILEQMDAAE